jgi:2-polyprenyl-6-methoxyphenol hydroxylase-like FAD-dependent oxidoreductase
VDEHYDVVVVGARCAGSPLATRLAEGGLSVALVDRATFPSDTPSTHIFQAEGVACLARLGVLERVLATGAPWLERASMRLGDVTVSVPWPTRPGDPGPQLCVRRALLDTILVERAAEAGATLHLGPRVVGLVREARRVVGVRVARDAGEAEFGASLVVGADGRTSTVARLVGARRYHVVPNQRFGYWGYYEGARWDAPASLTIERWGTDFVLACPADSGLYLVIVLPPLERVEEFRGDVDAAFDAIVGDCPPVAAALAGARRVGRLWPSLSHEAFFRESSGPGWVLVGDAGHFKDPAPGQGISDALRQVERLAPAVLGSWGTGLDGSMRRWARWRDADGREMHWFAADMGRAGTVPLVLVEIVRRMLITPDGGRRMFDVFNHRERPSAILTPARLARATASLLASGDHPRGDVMAELRDVLRREVSHRWRNRRPAYVPGD